MTLLNFIKNLKPEATIDIQIEPFAELYVSLYHGDAGYCPIVLADEEILSIKTDKNSCTEIYLDGSKIFENACNRYLKHDIEISEKLLKLFW